MASLKELKGRINSVKSTQKITKAKQMVAAAKLRKAQAAAEAARPYASRMAGVVASLASRIVVSESTPKLLAGTGKDAVHLLVVANSDRGLCGAFNSNIVKAARLKAKALQRWQRTGHIPNLGRENIRPMPPHHQGFGGIDAAAKRMYRIRHTYDAATRHALGYV